MQLLAALAVFGVVALVWLNVVYLPGRTLERWQDQRPARRGRDRKPLPGSPGEGSDSGDEDP